MKKLLFICSILVVMAAAMMGPFHGNSIVHAQAGGCTDPTGAPTACPTEDPNSGGSGSDSGGGANPGGGNPNPPAPLPTSTSTPLSIEAPTDSDSTGKAEWSGTCKGSTIPETTTCIGQFTNACESVGGSVTVGEIKDGAVPLTCKVPAVLPATPRPFSSNDNGYLGTCTNENFSECKAKFECEDGLLVIKVDLYASGGTKYDFYCIPHDEIVQFQLPLAAPTDDGGTEENWEGFCPSSDQAGLDRCSNAFKAACDEDGGDYSEFYEDNGSLYAVCENASESNTTPTEAPVIAAAPTDDGGTEGNEDWDESCSWATCWAVDLACWIDGGSGYGMDDGAGGVVYHCDMPEETEGNTFPGNPLLWIVGGLVILAAVAIPAFMKNARKAKTSEANSIPQTKEHVLLNKDDGGTEASDYLLEIDGVKGESKGHIKKAVLHVRKAGTDQDIYK